MTAFGRKLATAGIALGSVCAIAVAPTVQAPPRPVPAVHLAAATSPTVVQPPTQQSNVPGALFNLDLSRFIIPPSAGQPLPTPPQIPGPSPAPTDFEFEDAIINTYHAIEPWVRWGFELATYAVGWIPWVGWLSPQIMIFYNFGERIVESLVVNSANWLWGPLPFLEGLGNVAVDSWNALVQLGIDEWNFWLPSLPPLPPFPFGAQQAQAQPTAAENLAPADQQVAPGTEKLDSPDLVTPQEGDLPEADQPEADLQVAEPVVPDVQRVTTPADPQDDLQVQADLPLTDATPTNPDETKTDPTAEAPVASGAPSGVTSPPLTPLRKTKPFGAKPKPALENESVGVSNSSAAASSDSVGTPKQPKNRFNEPKKHRLTDSPSDSTASSTRLAPSR